jgi:integrase
MIYKSNKSPYWQYDFTRHHHRHYGSTGLTNKKDAQTYEANLKRDAALGENRKEQLTLDQACGTYARDVADRQPSWPTTKYQIANLIAGLGKDNLLAKIHHHNLATYAAKRRAKVSDTSVNREIEVARRVWRYAATNLNADVGQVPIWNKLMFKEPQERIRELSAEEEAALLANIRVDIRPMVEFALLSAARLSSVIKLKWSDVNLSAGVITFNIKGGEKRLLPLTPGLAAIIGNQPKTSVYVFTYVCAKSSSGKRKKGQRYPFSQQGWKKEWYSALEDAKITDFRFHDLRHTRATRILRETGNLKIVQQALGHTNIATTARYAHANLDDVRKAMAATESRNSPGQPKGEVDENSVKSKG